MPGFDSGSTMYALNVDFTGNSLTSGSPTVTTNGQLLIGSTALPNIQVGTLTSPNGTIQIGYSSPNITLDTTGGQGTTKFTVQTTTATGTNPVLPDSTGNVTVASGQFATGSFGTRVITINSPAPHEFDVDVQISTTNATSLITKNGICHFDSSAFSVDANGFVTSLGHNSNYTNVTHAMSPYTVLTSDYYISCDTSGGTVQLNFPNAPTAKQQWIVKDRTGNAATNNITLTTPGGTVTFDGLTTYTMNSNFQAVNLLANATPTYEIF